ncbi:hypothetical protein [Asanoa iriomotensis]|uniref:Uncharacterized protein n=1 Tax=Asanoa iriomotensis TaxID=234613 RepID=A0ABQ4BVJ8_9ACTN|nr:hypothetical protein [Asanoa iriomotensis]GIF54553.1 hypothetical protein Air01nite_06480 [Asanoa iriomotensis]
MTLALAVAVGCTAQQPQESLSADGVVGCADSAAWGQVATVTPEGGQLRVVLEPDRWLTPESSSRTVDFLADDRATESGAPPWRVGDRGLLILSKSSPPALYDEEVGQELERAWRDAGSRRLTDCPG